MATAGATRLSVIVVIVGDTLDGRCDVSLLVGTLRALAEQAAPPPMEVVVPYHLGVDGIDELKPLFPWVRFLRVDDLRRPPDGRGSREHHDELRARGMEASHGDIVAFLEDHVRPDEHWCARMIEAHTQPYAAVGGAVENVADDPLNWAAYFCDLGKYQDPLPVGESPFATTVNVSYKRTALDGIRSAWQPAFNETTVHSTLLSRGEKIALAPGLTVRQDRGALRLGPVARELFIWGRSYAAVRGGLLGNGGRWLHACLAPLLPGILLARMAARTVRRRRRVRAFIRALPLTALLTLSWSFGELVGYLGGRGAPRSVLAGARP